MSDCSTNAWGIPKPGKREEGVLHMHPLYSKELYEGLKAIEVHGVRFERTRKGRHMETKVNVRLDGGAYLPERAHDTDAGADIRTPVDIVVPARGSASVATGVHIETPANCVAMLKSKSGLNVKRGIVSEGVIDEGFTGEIIVKLYNHSDEPMEFERGDKITQVVIMPVLYPAYVQADEIAGGERGDAGYGSTGTR